MPHDNTPTKTCTRCKKTFPANTEYFPKRAGGKNGLHHYCKNCKKEVDRRYYLDNREQIIERVHKYSKDNKKKISDRKRIYRKKHAIHISEQQKIHRVTNRKKRAEYDRENRAKTRERYRDNNRVNASRRRARKRSLPDTFTAQQWLDCLDYFNYCCAVCSNQLRDLFGDTVPHADHWIPIASEECTGTIVTNMVCLCNHCNLSKGATMPQEWLSRHYSKKQIKHILDRIRVYFKSCD